MGTWIGFDVEPPIVTSDEREFHLTLAYLADIDLSAVDKVEAMSAVYEWFQTVPARQIIVPKQVENFNGAAVLTVDGDSPFFERRRNLVQMLGMFAGLKINTKYEPWVPHVTIDKNPKPGILYAISKLSITGVSIHFEDNSVVTYSWEKDG